MNGLSTGTAYYARVKSPVRRGIPTARATSRLYDSRRTEPLYRELWLAQSDASRVGNYAESRLPRMRARDVRADMAELVEVGDVDRSASRKRESPHLGAGLGKRAGLASCVSRATMAASPGEVNLTSAAAEDPRKGRTPPVF